MCRPNTFEHKIESFVERFSGTGFFHFETSYLLAVVEKPHEVTKHQAETKYTFGYPNLVVMAQL